MCRLHNKLSILSYCSEYSICFLPEGACSATWLLPQWNPHLSFCKRPANGGSQVGTTRPQNSRQPGLQTRQQSPSKGTTVPGCMWAGYQMTQTHCWGTEAWDEFRDLILQKHRPKPLWINLQTDYITVKSVILISIPMKIAVFWDMTQYILVDSYQPFEGSCCHHP
jgi:hypothetical protein